MVTVPRLTEQTVAPRSSGVPFQDPSAPQAAFAPAFVTAADTNALQEFSGVLAEAADRVQRRQAAVNRAKIRGETRNQMQADFTAEMTAGTAFGAPNSLEAYTNLQRQRIDQALQQHASEYGEESALMLAEAFESDLANLTLSGAQAGVEAGKKAVAGEIDVFARRQAAMAFADPGSLMDRFADIDREIITQYGDALTPDEERQVVENARAQVIEGAANHFIVRNDFTSAEAVLNNPIAVDNLSADRARQLRSSIAQGRHQQALRAAASRRAPTTVELALAAIDGDERAMQAFRLMNPERPVSEADSIPINLALLRGQQGVETGHSLVDSMTVEEAQNFYLAATENNASNQTDPLMAMLIAGNPELASMINAGEDESERRQRLFGVAPEAETQALGPVAPPIAGRENRPRPQPRAEQPSVPAVNPDIQAMSNAELDDYVQSVDVSTLGQAEVNALLRELERRGMNE